MGPPKDWRERFIGAFATMSNVRASCEIAGISRTQVYRVRREDEEFAELWRLAEEEAVDRLEQEGWRRAVAGVERPVYYKGQKIDVVREYSDRLLELLLKAHRPQKYNPALEIKRSDDDELIREIKDIAARLEEKARLGLAAGRPAIETQIVDRSSNGHRNGQEPEGSDDPGAAE